MEREDAGDALTDDDGAAELRAVTDGSRTIRSLAKEQGLAVREMPNSPDVNAAAGPHIVGREVRRFRVGHRGAGPIKALDPMWTLGEFVWVMGRDGDVLATGHACRRTGRYRASKEVIDRPTAT